MSIQCLNVNVSDIYSFPCPSHGWEAILNFLYTIGNIVDSEHLHLLQYQVDPGWVELVGHGSLRRLTSLTPGLAPKGYSPYSTVGGTQQSAIADALTEIGELWTNGMLNTSMKGHGNMLQRLDAVHTIKEGYYQPYTTATCTFDAINGPYDDGAVSFPVLSGVRKILG